MRASLTKTRVEAFSDGVIAVIITIMVLEMKVPHPAGEGGHSEAQFRDLLPVLPVFVSYVLSFAYLGIYWNNHHHMLHATPRVSGPILWANLHLLFWLSLIPFTTAWMGENHFGTAPTALYGAVLFMSGLAYAVLQRAIIAAHGRDSLLARAVGKDVKGKVSVVAYAAAIGLAFVHPAISQAVYVLVALMWLIPDRRIERAIAHEPTHE